MSVFHAPAHCASHSERGEQALARLVEQVNALRARPVTGEDFEAVTVAVSLDGVMVAMKDAKRADAQGSPHSLHEEYSIIY